MRITADWNTEPELRDCQVRAADRLERLEKAEARIKQLEAELRSQVLLCEEKAPQTEVNSSQKQNREDQSQ